MSIYQYYLKQNFSCPSKTSGHVPKYINSHIYMQLHLHKKHSFSFLKWKMASSSGTDPEFLVKEGRASTFDFVKCFEKLHKIEKF